MTRRPQAPKSPESSAFEAPPQASITSRDRVALPPGHLPSAETGYICGYALHAQTGYIEVESNQRHGDENVIIKKLIESDLTTPQLVSAPARLEDSGRVNGAPAPAVDSRCGDVAMICRRSPIKSEPNDDSAGVVYLSADAAVLVVADGIGGGPMGYKASAIAVETVVNHVSGADPAVDLRGAILNAIEAANQQILAMGSGAATTLAVVQIQRGIARAFNVGDSMMLIFGGRGRIKWKSLPHSPVGYAVESGLLDEADAMTHDDRHVISNYVGSREMHIEIGPSQRLAPRDTIIVGSDGLFDNMHLNEIVQLGRRGKPIHRVEGLATLATKRMQGGDERLPGKPDDLTILLYARSRTAEKG